MARAPSYSMGKQRITPSPYARVSERPSAFDRFPGKARNEWINEMRAKIDGTLNPPSPPGPSRSPSPLEEDGIPLGVAQVGEDLGLSDEEEEDEMEEDGEDEGYVSGEQEEDGSYDEDDEHEELEDENPLGLGSQIQGQESEEGFYEDDEDEVEDEGIEDEDEDAGSIPPQLALPTHQGQYLEDEDSPEAYTTDPRFVNQQAEGEWEDDSEAQDPEEDDEMEEDPQEDGEDQEKENSITYIGDTDEEEGDHSEDEEEDAGEEDQYTDDEDVEDEEIDDDGMGGPDALPLEAEGLEAQATYDAVAPIGVEHGQVVYDYHTSNAEMDDLRDTQAGLEEPPASYTDLATGFINSSQLPLTGFPQASGSGPSLYPPLPTFTPASQMIPPWEPSTLDPIALAAESQEMDNALIDPSLLADFAQRVEAQASGDLGKTTEAQNTTEMTALADAVMDQYNDTPEQILGAPQLGDIEVVQYGMGEAEDGGYEEDNGSRGTSEGGATQGQLQDAQEVGEQVLAGDEEDDGSDMDSDSQDESSSAASPAIVNTQDEPIEILSSDEEEEDKQQLSDEDADDQDEEDQDDEDDQDNEDEDEEEEEEEEVEPTRPAGQHTHFDLDLDMKDVLTPPHTSRSSGRTPIPNQPESPTHGQSENVDTPELGVEGNTIAIDEDEESSEGAKEGVAVEAPLEAGYPFSPMGVIEADLPIAADMPLDPQPPVDGHPFSPITIIDADLPIANDTLESESPVEPSAPVAQDNVDEGTHDVEVEVEQAYEPEIEEPVSRGPSMPLVTPAVELPLDAVFPTIPEAGLEAIMRVLEQPDVIEEVIDVEDDITEPVEDDQVEVTELEDQPEDMVARKEIVAVESETASAEAGTSNDQMEEEEGSEATPSPLGGSPVLVSATDFATLETVTQALPDPHVEPIETDLEMPEVPYHRSRTPSLIVEPPANPPNPDIVIDGPADLGEPETTEDLPDPQDPIPDTHIVAPLSPHDMRPTLERSPSLFVNVQEVEAMLDPGPNEEREESPVNFPEHDQPAPSTELTQPIEPEDLEPRDEPRSVSMEALAPGEAPLEDMPIVEQEEGEEEAVLFPEPGEAAPNSVFPSPLDVRRDLPLDVEGGSEVAPSLVVEPPSEPATGPPSLTGSTEEASEFLSVPDIVVVLEQDEEDTDIPTSSNIDIPSAPLRAITPISEAGPSVTQENIGGPPASLRATTPVNEAGPSDQHIRFASPLRHHHGHVPRHASVPPPSTRVTRRHTRQSSAAIDAITPPVTRQNCHYRKLYMAEGDMTATVLVPQCTLTDHDKLREEHSEDRGDATPADEDEARHQPICENTPRLQTVLTAKLHRIVGSDIFDEAQKTYLLSASDAALLPHVEEASGSTSTSAAASATPLKTRRKSKRLSEAPSETSIVEDSQATTTTKKHKRSVSVAHTASSLPEETEIEADAEGRYELRSKSEIPAHDEDIKEDDATEVGSEIEAVQASGLSEDNTEKEDEVSSATISPTSTSQPISKRYSLRSQPDVPVDNEVASDSRATTPTANTNEPHPKQQTPMTTRRRARESTSSGKKSTSTKHEDEVEPSTPKGKGKGRGTSKSKSQSPKKGKRDTDPRYIYSGDDETDDEVNERKVIKGEETETERESSAEIIPYKSEGTPSSGTGRKKRKLGSSLGRHNSPWQLGVQDHDNESEGTPSRRSKKRAVEMEGEPDIPVPVEVGEEAEVEIEEAPPLPRPRGWMSVLWPFKR